MELPFGRRAEQLDGRLAIHTPNAGYRIVLGARSKGSRIWRPNRLVDDSDNTFEVTWTADRPASITDSVGRVAWLIEEGSYLRWELHTYDEDSYLTSERGPDGVAWTFRYETIHGKRLCVETFGRPPTSEAASSSVDDRVLHASLTFDRSQSPQNRRRGRRGPYASLSRNALGQVEEYVAHRGRKHSYVYDPVERLLHHSEPKGRTSARYDRQGRMVGFRGPAGSLRGRYDDQGCFHARFPDRRGCSVRRENGKVVEHVGHRGTDDVRLQRPGPARRRDQSRG